MFIFSHQLAHMLNLTPVQVRRDLMLIGLSGNHRKGYKVTSLLKLIDKLIDHEDGFNVAVVGLGNLGSAVLRFIQRSNSQMKVVAAFDIDQTKINDASHGIPCYNVSKISYFIQKMKIDIIILTSSSVTAQEVANEVISAGVTGIMNFTSAHLDVPDRIYLKNYDIITSLEEIGYFIKNPLQGKS